MGFINKKTVKVAWTVTKIVGGAILWEGLKGVAWNSATNVLVSVVSNKGFGGVRKMTLRQFVGSEDLPKVVSKVESKAKAGRKVVDADWKPINVIVDQEND